MKQEQETVATAVENEKPNRRKKGRRRTFLFLLGPIIVGVIGSYLYWTGGRIVVTDNSYVQADKTVISAEVSGPIDKVFVVENQQVQKGDPLFALDDRDYVIALARAKANQQKVLADIRTTKAKYRQKLSELDLTQSDIDFAQKEYRRQTTLDSNQAVAKAQLDSAKHELDVETQKLAIIKTEKDQILAELEGNPDIDPSLVAAYRLAHSEVEKSALELERTVVKAPYAGLVSKIPTVGKHVEPGSSVMSLIANDNFWIEANLKETDLTYVKAGQDVEIVVDTYPDVKFTGKVKSISPATGSEFSIIPAQNATGNWVKVVQRIPVRVHVDVSPDDPQLCAGMSAVVSIDTRHQRKMPDIVVRLFGWLGVTQDAIAKPVE